MSEAMGKYASRTSVPPKETPLDDWRAWEVVEKIGRAMMEVEKR